MKKFKHYKLYVIAAMLTVSMTAGAQGTKLFNQVFENGKSYDLPSPLASYAYRTDLIEPVADNQNSFRWIGATGKYQIMAVENSPNVSAKYDKTYLFIEAMDPNMSGDFDFAVFNGNNTDDSWTNGNIKCNWGYGPLYVSGGHGFGFPTYKNASGQYVYNGWGGSYKDWQGVDGAKKDVSYGDNFEMMNNSTENLYVLPVTIGKQVDPEDFNLKIFVSRYYKVFNNSLGDNDYNNWKNWDMTYAFRGITTEDDEKNGKYPYLITSLDGNTDFIRILQNDPKREGEGGDRDWNNGNIEPAIIGFDSQLKADRQVLPSGYTFNLILDLRTAKLNNAQLQVEQVDPMQNAVVDGNYEVNLDDKDGKQIFYLRDALRFQSQLLYAKHGDTKFQTLKVNGHLNAEDMQYLSQWVARRGNVVTLDLSNAVLPDNAIPEAFADSTNFDNTTLTTLKLPATLKKIGASAFKDCKALVTVNIPDGASFTIGKQAFMNDVALKDDGIANIISHVNGAIAESAFEGCTGVSSVTIPENISSVDARAFANDANITKVTLPNYSTTATETNYPFTPVTGGYDLYVTNVGFDNETINPGDHVVFKATVVNAGDKDIPAGTVIGAQFQINGNTSVITWSDTYSGGLKSHASVVLTANGGTNGANYWTAQNGTFTITAWVDDVNRISGEVNESNNKTNLSLTIPYVRTITKHTVPQCTEASAFEGVSPNKCLVVFSGEDHISEYRADNQKGWMYLLTKTLDQSEDIDVVNQKHANVLLTRSFVDNWNTIVLPYNMTHEQLKETFDGYNVKVAEFNRSSYNPADKTSFFVFRATTNYYKANTPYLIMLNDKGNNEGVAYKTSYMSKDVDIVEHGEEALQKVSNNGYTFIGTYKNISDLAAEANGSAAASTFAAMYIKDNAFRYRDTKSTSKTKLKPYRAYFIVPDRGLNGSYQGAQGAVQAKTSIMVLDDTATGIDNINVRNNVYSSSPAYNLQGQRVGDDYKGIIIKNGKKTWRR